MNWNAFLIYRTSDTFDSLKNRLDELTAQSYPPDSVSVIVEYRSPHILDELEEVLNGYTLGRWFIQHAREDMFDELLQIDSAYNVSMKYPFVFYSVFESAQTIRTDFYDRISVAFEQDDEETYGYIQTETLHGMTAHYIAHKKFTGNGTDSLLEKILSYEPENVINITDVYKDFYE